MKDEHKELQKNSRFADFSPNETDDIILPALGHTGAMVRDVVAKTGLKENLVRWHLTTLELAGLVRSEKRRNFIYYYSLEGQ